MNAAILVLASTLTFRGGGYVRDDGGYLAHAQTFGWSWLRATGGFVVEAGTELAERLSVHLSWGEFSSAASKRLDTLELRSDAVLADVRYAAWRWQKRNLLAQAELALGAGVYRIGETFDGMERADIGAGVRVGGDVSIYWRWIGWTFGFGRHLAAPQLGDRLGGTVGAGGEEVTSGLSIRF